MITKVSSWTWIAVAIYTTMVVAVGFRHEPWTDEAQSWLLARDASLVRLWGSYLHYEGTPGVWQTLLHVLIILSFPYRALSLVSGLLGTLACILVVRYAPLPLYLRLLLPFTFYFCYQFADVARSYSLLPPLVFAAAALYENALRRLSLLTASLVLMAGVSAHGILLSLSIWLVLQWQLLENWPRTSHGDRKKIVWCAASYAAAGMLFAVSAWPAKDVTFWAFTGPHSSIKDFFIFTGYAFRQAFGEGYLPLLVLVLSVPLLWRGRAVSVFVLASAALCIFGAIVYSNPWSMGLILLSWLFAIWVAAERTRWDHAATLALLIVIAVQSYWSFRSIQFDWSHPYSGSREAAEYLKTHGLTEKQIFGIGVATVAVQPYFAGNIFVNYGPKPSGSFWDWSRNNNVNEAVESLGSGSPDYVLVGYLSAPERDLWTHVVDQSGYRAIKHFDGGIFWRTAVEQPESFDLYQRGDHIKDRPFASSMSVADPLTTGQLLSGFYELGGHDWRWTAQRFSVILRRPARGEQGRATLDVRLFIPEDHIKLLGPMTLRAQIGRHHMAAMTFAKSGPNEYVSDVPPEALYSELVVAEFSFDKAGSASSKDTRQLGAVVSRIGLEPK